MQFTYDTETDSISSPQLTPEQTRRVQSELSAALARNAPVQSVAGILLSVARDSTPPESRL